MPTSWIGTSILTDEIEVLNGSGVKIHDLLEQNDFGGDELSVSETTHPILYSIVGATLPNMTPPEVTTLRYKIIADAT